MNITPTEPSDPAVIREFKAGRFQIVELAFLFGQHRLAIWSGMRVLHPQF